LLIEMTSMPWAGWAQSRLLSILAGFGHCAPRGVLASWGNIGFRDVLTPRGHQRCCVILGTEEAVVVKKVVGAREVNFMKRKEKKRKEPSKLEKQQEREKKLI